MTNQQHIEGIMALVRNMRDDSLIELTLRNALEDTYRRGAESVRNSSNYHQPEDMGR